MIISKSVEQASLGVFDKLPAESQARILGASVALAGKSSKASQFTGSGVILYEKEGVAWLVTAKHNLYIWDELEDFPAWSDDRVAGFIAKVQIQYGAGMTYGSVPGQTAAISDLQMVWGASGQDEPWSYDVMIVQSTDANLVAYAQANGVYPNGTGEGFDRGFVSVPSMYLRKQVNSGNKKVDLRLVQVGFGTVTAKVGNVTLPKDPRGTNKAGALQLRIPVQDGQELAQVYSDWEKHDGYDRFDDAIVLSASANDGTAKGDSGGPLFVVNPLTKAVFLIGVTTGGDMPTAPTRPFPVPPAVAANNVATSLQYCYEQEVI